MLSLFLLSSLLVSALAQINPSNCGTRPAVESNIVGGTVAAQGAWPWIVSMRYNGAHSCGGSVINENWIVTAGHCVYGRSSSTYYTRYSLIIGADNRVNPNSYTITRGANSIILHPAYDDWTLDNDIALIKLDQPITFNNYIVPACLQTTNEDLSNQNATAAGWGTLSSGAFSLPTSLYEVKLPITTDAACSSYYGDEYFPDTMICAGRVGGNQDTCQGDSGGPLSYKSPSGTWNLIGLTSWGYGCGNIGVYTRVSYYADWVNQQITSN